MTLQEHWMEDKRRREKGGEAGSLSWIHLLISKISHVCQEIHDIKQTRKPKSNLLKPNYINTSLDEGWKDWNCTQEPGSNSSAKEDSGDEGDWGNTYSSHSTLCRHEPSNPDNPSHHAPTPPSPNLPPSESIQEPPGDLSPSPASKIVTSTPSLLAKLERKACNAALSSLVHISPSKPCATRNVLFLTWNRLGEESVEESGMTEESLSETGERGGGPGVAGLCLEWGGGMGMAIDKEGGAKDNRTRLGIGSLSPLQVQQRESWRDKMMAWRGIQCSLVKWSKATSRAANFTDFPSKSNTWCWRLSTSWLVTSTLPPRREKSCSIESQVRF